MKKNLLLIFALAILALIPGVLALQITSQDTFSANHNSVLTFNITADNTGGEALSNVMINITNIQNPSQVVSTTASNISSNEIKNYTILYNIPQYIGAGSYPATITFAGQNQSGAGISATKSITINVAQTKSISLSTGSISVSSPPGTTQKTTFTITNNGNVNITNILFSQSSSMQDNDNDTIALSLTSTSPLNLLQPGQTVTITVEANVPSNEDFGTYNTNIIVNSSEGVSATVSYSISLSQSLCDKGRKGSYFDIEITEPDSGDDFYPNDVIPVEVKARNDDDEERDVVIVANLFDATDNEFLDAEVETDGTVGDNTYEYFTVDLTVPIDVTAGHDYRVYAKVYEDGNEEEQCTEDYVAIDIKKQTHDVIIDKSELPDSASCDENFDVTLTLVNIGNKDEDVKVTLYNSELKINEEKTLSIDKGDKKKVTISPHIPKDATEGNHSLKTQVFFHLSNDEYQDSVTRTDAINVQGNCVVEKPNLALTTELLDTAYSGEQLTLKLNLFNTGDKTATYTITASGYEGWARLDKIDPVTVTLNPSETASSYLYLTALNTSGTKNMRVRVMFGDQRVDKDVNIDLKEKVSAPKAYQGFVTKLSNLTGFDLITVNIILGIAIILIIMWIIRVRRAY